MPLDPGETAELQAAVQHLDSAHQQLGTARQRLGTLLGGPHPPATAEQKIETYQKTYAEISN